MLLRFEEQNKQKKKKNTEKKKCDKKWLINFTFYIVRNTFIYSFFVLMFHTMLNIKIYTREEMVFQSHQKWEKKNRRGTKKIQNREKIKATKKMWINISVFLFIHSRFCTLFSFLLVLLHFWNPITALKLQ